MEQGELQTHEMIENAFSDGKRVFLPRIRPIEDQKYKQFAAQTSELQMLSVDSLDEVKMLKPVGKFNIREPQCGMDGKFIRSNLFGIV